MIDVYFYSTTKRFAISDITFAHFGPSLCGGAYCIATNVNNDDGQHPVEAKQIAMYSVKDDYKIVYHRPNIG